MDYVEEVKKCFRSQDFPRLLQLAREAFSGAEADEHNLAFVAGIAYETQTWEAVDMIFKFIDRFPDSLHPIRVFGAEFLNQQGRLDDATHEARFYLRLVKNHGRFNDLGQTKFIRRGVSMAFLILWPGYGLVGARSHARRILEHAQSFPLVPESVNWIKDDLARIEEELASAENKALDAEWETFLGPGSGNELMLKLCRHCQSVGAPRMADRFELLELDRVVGKISRIGVEELYLLVYKSENGKIKLLK